MDIVDRVVSRRCTIPILSNVRLQARNGALALTATDLDIELTVMVAGAVDIGVATTRPSKLLKDLLKKATSSEIVAITTGDDGLDLVDFERVNYRLQSFSAADFPKMVGPAAEQAHSFTMSGADFWDGLDCTIASISSEETRYYLNGIFMHVYESSEGLSFRMVSTDGHRLHRRTFAVPAGAEGMPEVIVPRSTVSLLHTLLKGKACPETVAIDVTESKIRFTFGDCVLVSKLIDGTFPDYNRVFPAYNDKAASFETAELAEALRAVSLISSERGKAFKLCLSDDTAELIVNNPAQGSAKAKLACRYDSDPVEIGFNSGYLGEVLGLIGDDITIKVSDAGSPAIITGSREGFTAILMPMRV